jgi:DNA-3-methyladenine glycosylase I
VSGAVPGPDGLPRCPWAVSTPEYLTYHDEEWGRPVRGDAALYERLCLEAFQSGLSWLTILRKRRAFRAAFAGFDPAVVAAYTVTDVERLLSDAGIVRNRAKIEAAVHNARAVVALGTGGLDALVWAYAPAPRPRPQTLADIDAVTPESTALARTLKRQGFRFVGPTTAYALMQACGLVDDHLAACTMPPPRFSWDAAGNGGACAGR